MEIHSLVGHQLSGMEGFPHQPAVNVQGITCAGVLGLFQPPLLS